MPYNDNNNLITRDDVFQYLTKYNGNLSKEEFEKLDIVEFVKAFVHRSYCTRKSENFVTGNEKRPATCLPLQEESNERLELLGDAVLSLIVAEYLFVRYKNENEGFLTRMRSKIVNGSNLSAMALSLNLNTFTVISKSVEENEGRTSKRVMEDCFEAFMGAMYLTLQYDFCYTWFVAFVEDTLDLSDMVVNQKNNKEVLMAHFRQVYGAVPTFVLYNVDGGKIVHCKIKNLKNVHIGSGQGTSKKTAEEEASRIALLYLGVK
jgi:ribonuclease-3